MNQKANIEANAETTAECEYFDVLIVGAGISGIGGAVHLQEQCPGRSYVILEAQDSFGGTWKTHTYPGIRSDSDLYTFGYRFKPWTGHPIATAEAILNYMEEVIEEHGVAGHIRYQHQLTDANWDSTTGLWALTATDTLNGTARYFSTRFLWMCQGYYRHAEPYTPEWPGQAQFRGHLVHPQRWPENLDYTGKRVLVIGSGATAATIVPAMAGTASHVTMLQRSPTYFLPVENRNEIADMLRELKIPEEWIHEIVRRKMLHDQQEITRRSFEEPEALKAELLGLAQSMLPEDFDIDRHLTPTYRPWQQRLALIPDGDLFHAIAAGKASIVTDHIDTFTERGLRTRSGEELEADIIVTATGFNLCVLGDVRFSLDHTRVDFAETIAWRGMMFSGVPNMLWIFGYLRASWTLRADLVGDFVCRLLKHMDVQGVNVVVPKVAPEEAGEELRPWIEADNFNAGYLQRNLHLMPKQGTRGPWVFSQDYWQDRDEIPACDLDDGSLVYAKAARVVAGQV